MSDTKKFQMLSLSGGGYRGLYTAQVLADLESHLGGKPIGQSFDLIAGTSVGGLLALAVAYEIPMSQVVDVFQMKGEQIFKPLSWNEAFKQIKDAKYSSDGLRAVLNEWFGENKIADLKHPVIIPAINFTTGTPTVFKTPHAENLNRDLFYKISDVALATSAAPTYFRNHVFDSTRYVDGGLFANDPSLFAIHEMECFFNHDLNNQTKMLSIGTLSSKRSANPKFTNGGLIGWAETRNPWKFLLKQQGVKNIIDLTTSTQQLAMQQMAKHRFERKGGVYVCIDETLGHASASFVGLDEVTDEAVTTLIGNAKQSSKAAIGNQDVIEILNHRSANPLWFNGPYKNTPTSI